MHVIMRLYSQRVRSVHMAYTHEDAEHVYDAYRPTLNYPILHLRNSVMQS